MDGEYTNIDGEFTINGWFENAKHSLSPFSLNTHSLSLDFKLGLPAGGRRLLPPGLSSSHPPLYHFSPLLFPSLFLPFFLPFTNLLLPVLLLQYFLPSLPPLYFPIIRRLLLWCCQLCLTMRVGVFATGAKVRL